MVYAIRCVPTGQRYVGLTVNLEMRKRTHLSHLRLGRHLCKQLQSLHDKYGAKSLEWDILEEVEIVCGGLTMATLLATVEMSWYERFKMAGLVIGARRPFNARVRYPGWTRKADGRHSAIMRVLRRRLFADAKKN